MTIQRLLSKLSNRWHRGNAARKRTEQVKRRRMLVEQLEDRKLLAAAHPLPLSSLSGTNGFRIDGVDAGDNSSWSVSNAGDVNGDGFDDLVLGARLGDAGAYNSGESYVVFGKSGGFTSALALSSLDGTNGFRLDGVSSNEQSGNSVSAAGDVNGDGFDDLIVGTRYGGPGWPGESHVVFGKSTGFDPAMSLFGLDGTTGFRIQGATNGDRSGYSVSGAGDVNGDGFDDLIVGGLYADPSGRVDAGSSYVIFGKSGVFGTPDIRGYTIFLNTLSSNNGFRLDGVDQLDKSGRKVSSAGDVNGDGLDDLLVAAREGDTGGYNSGESYVVFGKTGGFPSTIALSSLDGTNGFRLDGIDTYDGAGQSLSSAGDVNGDGFDDLIVGASGADHLNTNSSGESYVVFGKSGGFDSTIALSGLNGTSGFRIDGTATNDASGYSVSGAGDVNGDGFDDLLIGAFGVGANPFRAGASYLLFGKSGGFASAIALASLNGNNGFRMDGVNTFDGAGRSLSGAEDVNGDGFDDLIVGAPTADPNGSDSGSSYVIFGGNFTGGAETQVGGSANDTLTANQGPAAVDILIGGLGNDTLASDGGSDVLIGGPGDDILAITDTNFTGTRRLVGGNGLDTLRLDGSNLTLDLTTIPDNRIVDIEQIDISGTGNNSLILSASEVLNLSTHSNSLIVRRNAGDAVNIGSGWTQQPNEMIGPDTFEVFTQEAATVKIRHFVTTIDLSNLGMFGTTFFGIDSGDSGSRSSRSAGDVNGDGFDDLIIGADRADGFNNGTSGAGECYVIFGPVSPNVNFELANLGSAGITIFGADISNFSGGSVSSAGDVNGDGFDDLIIGAPGVGHSYVIYGAALMPSTIELANLGFAGITILGSFVEETGRSVSSAGDVNNDGFDDLIIGAPHTGDHFAQQDGKSYVIYGAASLPATIELANLGSAGVTILGDDVHVGDHNSGISVSSAGDVNGDGFDDLIIGALKTTAVSGGPGEPTYFAFMGESFVIFGSASLPATIELANLGYAGITILSAEDQEDNSSEVSSAGDINGDGFDDLIIGANGADGMGNAKDLAGESYVIFGAASMPSTIELANLGTAGITIFGADVGDRSGSSVSNAGDINADGYDDLIIGAFVADSLGNARPDAGESYVIFGAALLPPTIDLASPGSLVVTIFGVDEGDYSGVSVSSAGDTNGDGFDDLIIGAIFADGLGNADDRTGESYLVLGGNFFTNSIFQEHLGTTAQNVIVGTTGANIMNGADGDDTLVGNGGSDVLIGGRGNDVLAIADLSFKRIDGRNGFDTLRLDGSGHSLNLLNIPDNRIVDIEQIDVSGTGNNTLTLTASEVLNLSSHSNTLVVRRDTGDVVNIGPGWTQQANEMIGPDTFEVYTQGAATLKVQQVSVPASIVASHVYHFGSSFDLPGNLANALDTGKQLAKEGPAPQLLNYSHLINSSRGINGVVFDFANLAGTPTASDFTFQMSPTGAFDAIANPVASWASAPAPSSVSVISGSPSRVVITWPNEVIVNRWLRITVNATANTGLAEPEVYYLGHLLGETTGPSGSVFTVSFADVTPIRTAVGSSVNASSIVDIDKNGTVAFADISAMRPNVGAQLTIITIPASGGGGGVSGEMVATLPGGEGLGGAWVSEKGGVGLRLLKVGLLDQQYQPKALQGATFKAKSLQASTAARDWLFAGMGSRSASKQQAEMQLEFPSTDVNLTLETIIETLGQAPQT